MKIGVVGTSSWTERVHGPGAAASPHWDLAAIYGRSPEKAAALAAALGCQAASDFEAFLDLVDAVVFAVPPDVQAPLAAQAARAGKHLLLEKPLALDPVHAADVVAAVGETGVANLVFFTRLWVPQNVSSLDELQHAGGWETGRYEHLVRLPDALLETSPWRAEHGALWDVGPHGLSVLERVLGPATAVTAVHGIRDQVHLVLRHGAGVTSSAELALTAPEGVNRTSLRFSGSAGESTPDLTVSPTMPLDASSAALAELADQVSTGRRGGVDATYGLHVVEVLAAAQRSLDSGREEPVSRALEARGPGRA
jgi:predicted dehydrogenase